MPLTYQQSVEKLLSLADFERKARANESPDFHIQRTQMLMEGLGNPQNSVPAVHVAGSKGKGSTCAMIASALTACGLKTGMFISPHLHRMTERFTIDGISIPEAGFVSLFERIWPVAEAIRERGDSGTVSVFEFQTAMAFLYFAEAKCDAMVIEVGLGGRLDSTNVITPQVSVITQIGFDHVAVLGDTLTKIATEKAGIIKPVVPIVTASQESEATTVISETAQRKNAPLTHSSSVAIESEDPNGAGPQLLSLISPENRYTIELPLLGKHQLANVTTAIAAVEIFLEDSGFDAKKIAEGISNVRWPGRVQLLEAGPPMLITDGAHNQDSAEALRDTLQRHFELPQNPVLILGSTGGHDPLAVARTFADLDPRVVVTRSRHPKAVLPSDFAEALEDDRISVIAVTESTTEALETARKSAEQDSIIVAAGSLFIAAEVIEAVSGIESEMYPDLRGATGPVRIQPEHSRSCTTKVSSWQ